MGHGDRWAVLGVAQDLFEVHFPKATTNESLVHACTKTVDEVGETTVVMFHYYPDGPDSLPIAFTSVLIDGGFVCQTAYSVLASHTPPAYGGVIDIQEDCRGIEGIVSIEVPDGPQLTFFAPWYPRDSQVYMDAKHIGVRFAALTYHVQAADSPEFEIDAPPPFQDEDSPKSEKWTLTTGGMATYFRGVWDDAFEDDFRFRTTVEDIREMSFQGVRIFVTEATLVGVTPPVRSTFYIPESSLADGVTLKPGMDIEGSAWLQGFLA